MSPRMKPLADRDPFKIGIAALAALVLLGIGVVVLSSAQFGKRSYTAVLEQTAGLRTGEAVEVAGVPVGEVTAIKLDTDTVSVRFTMDSGIELGPTTTAEVKVATLLGTHYLEVHPRGAGTLANGTIPLAQTSVPYNLQDVIEGGTSSLETLDSAGLAQALTAVSDTLSTAGDDLGPALRGVSALSQVIAKRSEQTGDLLAATNKVSTMLADDSDDIVGLMKQTNLVLAEITTRRETIHNLLIQARQLATSLSGTITDNQAQLKPALADLDAALAVLRKENGALKKVLDGLAPAVRYISNATGSGPWVDLYIQGPAIPGDDTKCQLKVVC